MRSDQLGQLFAALSAAQGEFSDVLKDKTADAGKYKYAYADLADAIKATKSALTKHGLAVTQLTRGAGGSITVTTILGHKSGEFIGDEWEIPASGLDMQRLGGLITYARRYSYTAILGIAADTDDDAQEATAAQRQHKTATKSGAELQEKSKPAAKTDDASRKPVSQINRAAVSALHDQLEVLRGVDLKTASGDDKAVWADSLKRIIQDANAQFVLRGLDTLRKPADATDAWRLVSAGVSELMDYDNESPVEAESEEVAA